LKEIKEIPPCALASEVRELLQMPPKGIGPRFLKFSSFVQPSTKSKHLTQTNVGDDK
jgi:hypothetical protein